MRNRGEAGGGGGASALLLLQDLVELVGVLAGLDPDEEGDGPTGVLVVDRRVGHAHHHHVVLPDARDGHGRLHNDVEQDVSWQGTEDTTVRLTCRLFSPSTFLVRSRLFSPEANIFSEQLSESPSISSVHPQIVSLKCFSCCLLSLTARKNVYW